MKILCADILKAPADIELKIFGEDAEIIIADAKNNNDISDDIWNSCNAILAYDQLIYDLANFLHYTADPSRLERERIGIYVLLFLAFFFVFTWLLGREYTKEQH